MPATLGGARRTRARRGSTRGRATSARPRWTMLLLRAAAFAATAQALRQILCGHRDHRDGRHRDRGAEPHDKSRGDAGPEQALRQREHQNQDRARTGPDADRENRAKAPPPAAGTSEFAGLGTMGVSAMLVMDVAVAVAVAIMIMRMVVVRSMGVGM